jgi:hypothetical protein
MNIRKPLATIALGPVALAAAALGSLAAAGPADAAAAASTCGQAVLQTRSDLANAGAPSGASGWQGLRADAQTFVNGHAWGSPATDALRGDVNDLNRNCAP